MIEKNEKFENTDELIEKIFLDQNIESIKKDIKIGDELMKSRQDLQPPAEIVSNIKKQLGIALAARRVFSWNRVLVKAAAAAAIIILGFAIFTYDRPVIKKPDLAVIETSDETAADLLESWDTLEHQADAQIATLSLEIERLASTIIALELENANADNGAVSGLLDEFELELIETETTFWKG